MRYYTSDLHFGYEVNMKLCNRPFNNVETMNWEIINRFNTVLKKDDILMILGDVGFAGYNPAKLLQKINGHKVLIMGNHDYEPMKHKSFRDCFSDVRESEFIVEKWRDEQNEEVRHKIYLSHFPIAEWDGFYKGIWHFYGHVHNSKSAGAIMMSFYPRAVNVGADVHNFYPKTARQLIEEREQTFSLPSISMADFINQTALAKGDGRTPIRRKKNGNH